MGIKGLRAINDDKLSEKTKKPILKRAELERKTKLNNSDRIKLAELNKIIKREIREDINN